MEEDFKIKEEQSEYISISKLQKSFLESDLNIQSILQEISCIYQQSHDSQIKTSIRSILKNQLSNHSSNLQQSLSNLNFSLDEDQQEDEEQKQNHQDDDYQNQQKVHLSNQNLFKPQNGDNQSINISYQQMSVNNSNKFQPNFYRDLNNIELSREYKYFKDVKFNSDNQISKFHNDSNPQNENEVDTLQYTNKQSQIINDEVYQRRQSEKKNNGEDNSQKQFNCSSFVKQNEEQEIADANQSQLRVPNKQSDKKLIQNIEITDDNQNISQVRNRSQISQSNSNDIQIQKLNQEDLGQNIEGQDNNVRKQNKNQQRLIRNRNYFLFQIQNNKNSLLFLLLVISITLAILVALKPKIMPNFLFLNYFKEDFKQIQFKELQASLEVQIKYTQKLQQQLKEIAEQKITLEKEQNATIQKLKDGLEQQQLVQQQKEFEQQKNINNLQLQLEQLKQLMINQQEQYNQNVSQLQLSLQSNIQQQEFLQQQNNLLTKEKTQIQSELLETTSKYDQLKELYDNLHQVLELFKKTSF
ncbi:transmembrane protein, putative (macronuclear) [Tetrahymena thermophila SB210]|uniref:Transmembrane protein, putative n=1 Tax=Tetrahymena thermophila (strain SB210) TaxID=312017 RepID=Q22X28_TETTS|nr:transmembrane protein, putative [Tetrahymena thermophila SB210]EAR89818.1 transmembrane protein, putative [Tetrahymena thermophila SB210]|eukprot:XP_001010063.1 transmembrane protein, putative [Tetrahymena thermophila SB210]